MKLEGSTNLPIEKINKFAVLKTIQPLNYTSRPKELFFSYLQKVAIVKSVLVILELVQMQRSSQLPHHDDALWRQPPAFTFMQEACIFQIVLNTTSLTEIVIILVFAPLKSHFQRLSRTLVQASYAQTRQRSTIQRIRHQMRERCYSSQLCTFHHQRISLAQYQ